MLAKATEDAVAGHIWPTGRYLPTPAMNETCRMERSVQHAVPPQECNKGTRTVRHANRILALLRSTQARSMIAAHNHTTIFLVKRKSFPVRDKAISIDRLSQLSQSMHRNIR